MKKLLILACATTVLTLTTGLAMADSIKGKVGVTGKIGFLIPADNDIGPYKNNTDPGFIGGGGFIYGIDDHFAAEIDITRTSFESDFGKFGTTNLSLGGQYRFAISQPQIVPYLGAGLDILMNDADQGRNVDTTVGVHGSAGVDYFITKRLALTTELKLVVAADSDITSAGGKVGNFNPNSFSTTFGVRYFFN
jgi:outer membrane protein